MLRQESITDVSHAPTAPATLDCDLLAGTASVIEEIQQRLLAGQSVNTLILVTCNSEFDSSFSLTPNFSWVSVHHQSVATVSTFCRLVDVAKLLKQFGDPRSTNHPS